MNKAERDELRKAVQGADTLTLNYQPRTAAEPGASVFLSTGIVISLLDALDLAEARITAAVAEERERAARVVMQEADVVMERGTSLNFLGLRFLAGRIAYPPDAQPRPSSASDT